MQIRLRNKNEYTTSKWLGGETTELLIFPSTASYTKRDFQWRISKATITALSSQFTLLPGIRRTLLLLKGALLLNIENKGKHLLLPGDEINWIGKDPVQCKGTGTDFNVMIQGKGKATTHLFGFKKNEKVNLNVFAPKLFLYAFSGKVSVKLGKRKYLLEQEMSLEIEALEAEIEISCEAKTKSELVVCELILPS